MDVRCGTTEKIGIPLLGRIALQRGLVSPDVLLDCLDQQRVQFGRNETPLTIGQILLTRGIITLTQLISLLHSQREYGDGDRGSTAGTSSGFRRRTETTRRVAPFPECVGKYHLIREIDRGGMGIVFEAEDWTLGRKVALKILHPAPCAADVSRLRREAVLAARLNHPRIVRVYDVGTDFPEAGGPGLHFLAMEYVEGRPLEALMPDLPQARKLRILREIASATAYAHGQGIVHRDLKPGNILIREDGTPVVIDFGLARWNQCTLLLTQPGEILGTPLYAAPEQLDGTSTSSFTADVWSLGVMLYEAVTGRHPFFTSEVGTIAEVLGQVLHRRPVSPRKLNPGISVALERTCLRALDKDPSERQPDAGAFLHDWVTAVESACDRAAGSPIRDRSPRRSPRIRGCGL